MSDANLCPEDFGYDSGEWYPDGGPEPPDGKWHVDGWQFMGWVLGGNYLTPDYPGWVDRPPCPPWTPVYRRLPKAVDTREEPF